MPTETYYPIVEMFESIQGEGYNTGLSMFFIRFGGCSVGRHEGFCTPYFGPRFECDTEYQIAIKKSLTQILEAIPKNTKRICITGGEPLMYNLNPLILALAKKAQIHIETSGTIKPKNFKWELCHVTVSPKVGCDLLFWKSKAWELKFLVEKNLEVSWNEFAKYSRVSIQPIWNKNYKKNLQYAIKSCKEYPFLRLSLQMHKYIGVK